MEKACMNALRRGISSGVLAALAACGGASPTPGSTTTPASRGDATSAAPSDAPRASPRRSRQSAVRTASASEFEPAMSSRQTDPSELALGDRTEVPGTGVSMRPPRGSELSPVGAGFVQREMGVRILVAVVNGTEDSMGALVASLGADATLIQTDSVSISGHTTPLVTDRRTESDTEIERVWTVMRDHDRAMAVVGAYPANRSDRLRSIVRASVLSTEWDATRPVEPERAVGVVLTPPEGLAAEPEVVNGLTYLAPGSELSPASGRPVMLVVPLPIDVPRAERSQYCEQILTQVGPVSPEVISSRAAISTDTMQGCEVFGVEDVPSPVAGGPTQLATYAAIVFLEQGSFMIAGCVDAAQRDAWAPRFTAATRSIRRVPR
jgi:hypothetical protein